MKTEVIPAGSFAYVRVGLQMTGTIRYYAVATTVKMPDNYVLFVGTKQQCEAAACNLIPLS